MKVAIIGAGLAGLSCALELEKHEIYPEIFEVNSYVGHSCLHASFSIGKKFTGIESLPEIASNLGIKLKPLNTINKAVLHTGERTAVININEGCSFNNYQDDNSLRIQLSSQLKHSRISFSRFADYQYLEKSYDHVVIASGNSGISDVLGCWHNKYSSGIRGASLLGSFDPHSLIIWENLKHIEGGYAVLTPLSAKKASVFLALPNTDIKEMDFYWELFLYISGLKFPIIEEFKVEFRTGYSSPLSLKNMIFTGNAAIGTAPFSGAAISMAVISGVYAARSITGGNEYEKYIKRLYGNINGKPALVKNFYKNDSGIGVYRI